MPLRFKNRKEHEDAPQEAAAAGEAALIENGLLASWYMDRRLLEEAERAQRYGRQLTLLQAAPLLLPGEAAGAELLKAGISAARRIARTTDLLGWGSPSSLLIIMPETDMKGAEAAASRWQSDLYLKTHVAGARKWRVSAIDATQYQNAADIIRGLRASSEEAAA